uniref:Uncharacterized protein n=1 Tax=Timema cristinae TaxID=61476 RepID=A0A7R9CL00_TIMCR|nr:unnamed protein product [Timema cristinae]
MNLMRGRGIKTARSSIFRCWIQRVGVRGGYPPRSSVRDKNRDSITSARTGNTLYKASHANCKIPGAVMKRRRGGVRWFNPLTPQVTISRLSAMHCTVINRGEIYSCLVPGKLNTSLLVSTSGRDRELGSSCSVPGELNTSLLVSTSGRDRELGSSCSVPRLDIYSNSRSLAHNVGPVNNQLQPSGCEPWSLHHLEAVRSQVGSVTDGELSPLLHPCLGSGGESERLLFQSRAGGSTDIPKCR